MTPHKLLTALKAPKRSLARRYRETIRSIDSLQNVEGEPFTKAFLKMTYVEISIKSEKPRTSQMKWQRDCDLYE